MPLSHGPPQPRILSLLAPSQELASSCSCLQVQRKPHNAHPVTLCSFGFYTRPLCMSQLAALEATSAAGTSARQACSSLQRAAPCTVMSSGPSLLSMQPPQCMG